MYEYESYVTGEKFYSSAKLKDLNDKFDRYGLPIFYSLSELLKMTKRERQIEYKVLDDLFLPNFCKLGD